MFNRYVVVPLLVWAIAQFLKFVLAAIRGRTDFKYLYASGGMPSVHSAVVTSLTVTAFLVDGVHSAAFGISAILAAIVMYDSFGVRRSSGEQAIAINRILDEMDSTNHAEYPRLREILGHKPLEVTVGAIIGFVLALIFNYDKIDPLLDILSWQLPQLAFIIIGGISIAALILFTIGRWILLRRYKSIAIIAGAIKRIYLVASGIALLALAWAFLAYEGVDQAQWVVWLGVIAAIKVMALTWLYLHYRGPIAQALIDNKTFLDKQQWFEGPNKKRRSKKARSKKRK